MADQQTQIKQPYKCSIQDYSYIMDYESIKLSSGSMMVVSVEVAKGPGGVWTERM
jgi:hypothetical protein